MNLDKFNQILESSDTIVLVQADNPDGDSLASSLALENILESIDKQVIMYCGVEIPTYLRHISGWDRVVKHLPNNFDISIILDCSSLTLLENLQKSGEIKWLMSKPSIIIDHHSTESDIDFVAETIYMDVASTGELIYAISSKNNWPIDLTSAEYIATSILSDTLGLTTESVSYSTMLTMAELINKGVSLAKLDDSRRQSNKKSIEILKYKGKLLERVDISYDKRIATVHIPWEEIEKFSHEYNPSMLVLDEMRMLENVEVAIAFKSYPDGKVTAKIRTNYGIKIANTIAEHFGGGGHNYAAGFKINKARPLNEVKKDCLVYTSTLLENLTMGNQ